MSKAHPFNVESVVFGPSARMRSVLETVQVISEGDSTVLLCGETGTGKELVARMIHFSSARRKGPFVPVSCALAPDTPIESELFGHERGAFAGAVRQRAGRFERAAGGTIFLDDIDDAPTAVQVRLTRVLCDRVVERLGASRSIPVDVRVIAASARDLRALVTQRAFRDDLFHCLGVITIVLPPLRERREDVPALMRHFLAGAARRRGVDPPVVSPQVEHAFVKYDWPGNVRELENACERLAQTCTCGVVRTGCIPPQVLFDSSTSGDDIPAFPPLAEVSLDDRLREVEAHLIAWALRAAGGNKSRAAELLHIKRTTLADRITRHGDRVFVYAGRPSGDRDESAGQAGVTAPRASAGNDRRGRCAPPDTTQDRFPTSRRSVS